MYLKNQCHGQELPLKLKLSHKGFFSIKQNNRKEFSLGENSVLSSRNMSLIVESVILLFIMEINEYINFKLYHE